MTQEVLKLSQEALAGLKDVEKQVRELVAENRALKEALAQTEQEPVAQPASEEDMKIYKTIASNYHKDLSTPLQRKPLTDEWIRSRCGQTWVFETAKQWIRLAEAAHGIKDN